MVDKTLTEVELKKATKKAIKGKKELTIREMKELEAANRANSGFKPLIETLTDKQRQALKKEVGIK